MKVNRWTLALAAAGVVSFASAHAEEAQHQVLTALSSTTLSGYVDTSAIWKFGTGNANMPGRVFDGPTKQDGFNLEVVSVNLEKPLDEGEWSAGYNVNLLFGPNAVGWNPSIGSANSDFSLMDAYVTLRAPVGNGIDFKIGTFDKIIGYEHFHGYMNPNYSRSYGFAIGPSQNTGVLATYQINDELSISAGIANTASTVFNSVINSRGPIESQKSYMGAIRYIAPDSFGALAGTTIEAGIVDGFAGTFVGGDSEKTTFYYAGLTVPTPLEGLAVGGAFDYVSDAPNNLVTGDNWAWTGAGYVSYQATEKLKVNTRLEYLTGTAGTLAFTTGPGNEAVKVGALTLTVDYSLWENVISRAEFRWDHDMNGTPVFGNPGALTKNALSLAANIIYRF